MTNVPSLPPWVAPPAGFPDIAELLDLLDEAIARRAKLARSTEIEAAVELANDLTAGSGELPAGRAGWVVDDLSSATWAAAMWSAAQDELDVLNEQNEEYLASIDRWYKAARRRPALTAAFFAQQLETWALDQRATNPKRATFPLPGAVVRTTQHKPKVVVLKGNEKAAAAKVIEWGWPLDAVQLTGVYVDPMRARLRPAVHVVGLLSCNHRADWYLAPGVNPESIVGTGVLCEEMHYEVDDDGEPLEDPVSATVASITVGWAVIDVDGDPVDAPAFAIDPPHLTAKIGRP